MPSEMWYLFGGIVATVLVIGLVVVVKSKVIIQREEIIDETIILSKEMLDPTRYGVKAVLMVAFDPAEVHDIPAGQTIQFGSS